MLTKNLQWHGDGGEDDGGDDDDDDGDDVPTDWRLTPPTDVAD